MRRRRVLGVEPRLSRGELDFAQVGRQLGDQIAPLFAADFFVSQMGISCRRNRRCRWRRCILEYQISPFLKYHLGDVKPPVNSFEESFLVDVDLLSLQPRDLTPCSCRVVAVLKVLRGQNQGSEEHTTTALLSTDQLKLFSLQPTDIPVHTRKVRFDDDEIVEGNLQG